MQQEECEHKTTGEWDTLKEMYGSSEISHDCSAPVGTFLCNLNKKLKKIYIYTYKSQVCVSKDEIEENSHRSRFQCAVYKLLVVVCKKKKKQTNKITGKNFIKMFTLQIYVVNDLVYFMGKTVLFIMFSWNFFFCETQAWCAWKWK